MNEVISIVLMFAGSLLLLLAAVGITRMPDVFLRMQAAAKASTLGAVCLLLGVAFHFADLTVTTKSLLIIGFLFITTPVATHMMARAAYVVGVPLWAGTVRDDLKGQYHRKTHQLGSAITEDTGPLLDVPIINELGDSTGR